MIPQSKDRFSEGTLRRFLKPYQRVTRDELPKICGTRINESQVTVWTFKDGVWSCGQPDALDGSRSWCYAHLASKWSDDEYQAVKKDLFSNQDELNGVYRRRSETGKATRYAIVYRPTSRLSTWKVGTIASGVALVGGLGLVGARLILRDRPRKKKLEEEKEANDLLPIDPIKKEAFANAFETLNFNDMIRDGLLQRMHKEFASMEMPFNADIFCTFQIAQEYERLAHPALQTETDLCNVERMLKSIDTCPSQTIAAACQIFERRLFDKEVYDYVARLHIAHVSALNSISHKLDEKHVLSKEDEKLIGEDIAKIRNYIKLLYVLETISPGHTFENALVVLESKSGGVIAKSKSHAWEHMAPVELSDLQTRKEKIEKGMRAQSNDLINLENLPQFGQYEADARRLSQNTGNFEFLNHVHFIRLLQSLQVSQDVFKNLFGKDDFKSIIEDPLFGQVSKQSKDEFDAGGDEYCTFQIAKDYQRLTAAVSQDDADRGFEGLMSRIGTCSSKTIKVVRQLFSEVDYYLISAAQGYEEKYYPIQMTALNEINRYLDLQLEKKPDVSNEAQINKKIKKMKDYLEMFEAIREHRKGRYLRDYVILLGDTNRTLDKLSRCIQLRELGKSQKQMLSEIKDLVARYDITQPIGQEYADFANTFPDDVENEDVLNLKRKLEEQETYNKAKKEFPVVLKGYALPVYVQLIKDLHNNSLNIGNMSKENAQKNIEWVADGTWDSKNATFIVKQPYQ